MGLIDRDDGWRMPDWLWEKIAPLLPLPPPHPLGTHRRRIPDRQVMNAILLVLRTGMQWNALRATGICNSSSAHRRFQEWERAGVFHEIWRQGLLDYDEVVGIDWSWLAAERRLGHGAVGGQPRPVDAHHLVVVQQSLAPDLMKDPGALPLLEASMGAAGVADPRGAQGVPLHAGAQHQQDGVHDLPIGDAPAVSAQRVGRRQRQQRRDLLPQPVRHAPAVVAVDESHESLLMSGSSRFSSADSRRLRQFLQG